MSIALLALLIAALLVVTIEIGLRYRFPYRLRGAAFEESSVVDSHPTRGWTQRGNVEFTFHHRYLSQTNKLRFNNLGLHAPNDCEPSKPANTIRLILFGGSASAGWELPANHTIAAQLESILNQRAGEMKWQVWNASARNYCTAQLYDWYLDSFAQCQADFIVYYFNTNHPRRNITLHEGGKDVVFHQPVFAFDTDQQWTKHEHASPLHKNDLIYFDADGSIKHIAGQDSRSLHRRVCDRVQLYDRLEEAIIGPFSLRRLSDRQEIKDLEKRELGIDVQSVDRLPYHWRATAELIKRWAAAVKRNRSRFLIVPHLHYYYAGGGSVDATCDHPANFSYETIPERRFLPLIAAETELEYFDTYAYAKQKKIRTEDFYIHPRYAYASAAGAQFQAEVLAEACLMSPR